MSAQNPLMAAFAEQVRRRYSPSRPESFWACEPLFRHLADPTFAQRAVNDALRAISIDPDHVGDWSGQQITLMRDPAWTLSLVQIERPHRYIHSSISDLLVAPVGGLPVSVDLYDLPAGFHNAVFDPSLKLDHAGSSTLDDSTVLSVRAERQVIDFRIERPLLLLKLTAAPVHTLEWLFSRDTLHPWQANDADGSMTQLRTGLHVLARFAHQSSLVPIRSLTAHANPNIRWAAIQSLGRLSRADAQSCLRKALDDPHPQLRRAARQALDEADVTVRRR